MQMYIEPKAQNRINLVVMEYGSQMGCDDQEKNENRNYIQKKNYYSAWVTSPRYTFITAQFVVQVEEMLSSIRERKAKKQGNKGTTKKL